MPPKTRRMRLPLILLLAVLPGCGRGTGTVTGKVVLGANAAPSGIVVFTTADGIPFSAPVDKDGRYKLAKVPAGEVKISVVNSMVRPGGGPVKDPDAAPAGAPPAPIPKQYENPDNGLKYTVQAGTQTHDIELRP